MSAWLKIAQVVGKGLGNKVKSDLDAVHKLNAVPNWTHKDKISDLAGDRYLAPEYLEKLIANSNSKQHLGEVAKYLADRSKTGNLPEGTLLKLKRALGTKFENVEMKELLEILKEALL